MEPSLPLAHDEPGRPDITADPERMREILQRHLQPTHGKSFQVTDCRITNQRHRDGTRGSVQYDVRFVDPDSGQGWDQVVTGLTYGVERTRRVWDAIRSSHPSPTATLVPLALQPYAYVPELDMLLQVFPHDHRLPALAALLAGPLEEIVPDLLLEFGPGHWQVLAWNATTVQYRVDMRAIVQLNVTAVDSGNGQPDNRQFYAKVYRDANQARQSHRALRRLREHLADSGEKLAVSKPVAYADGLRTLVTLSAPGTSLAKIIRRGEDVNSAMRSAARAIAELHHLDVEAPPRAVEDDIARLREAEGRLHSARPDLAKEISLLVDAVATGLAGTPSMLIHGDLKPEHILIDGELVTLLDFDLMGSADPIVDVAHLVAFLGKSQVRTRLASEGSTSPAQVFLDEYFQHVPALWRERLPLYYAMTSIQKAVGLSRRGGPDCDDVVEDILREGQALLEGGISDSSAPSYKRRLTRAKAR